MDEKSLISIEDIAQDSRYNIMPSVRQHILNLVNEIRRLKKPADTCTGFYATSSSVWTCSYCNGNKIDHFNGKIKIVEKQWLKEKETLDKLRVLVGSLVESEDLRDRYVKDISILFGIK